MPVPNRVTDDELGTRFTLEDVRTVLIATAVYVLGGGLLFGAMVWLLEALLH